MKGDPFTNDMKAYLQLQYKICPLLGERGQLIADLLKTTKSSIMMTWSRMRKANNELSLKPTWTPDQLSILIRHYDANKKFSPAKIALELGLDPKNKKDIRRIYSWKDRWTKKNP